MKQIFFLIQIAFILCFPFYSWAQTENACGVIYQILDTVPHSRLTQSEGQFASFWDQSTISGCQVTFVTDESLLGGKTAPDLEAGEGSLMYRRGWRMNHSYLADGPGTGLFGIEKESVLCLIRHEQPAYLDDYGKIIQSETLTLDIQCQNKSGH